MVILYSRSPEARSRGQRVAAGKSLALTVRGLLLYEDRRVVVPARHVEEPGARAVRRRIPVRPALDSRKDRCPLFRGHAARNADRTAVVVDAAGPVHLHE